MTNKKKTTATKVENIDLEEMRKTKMINCNLEIPDDMQDFFEKNKEILLQSILPCAGQLFLQEQPIFSCFVIVNGKRYAFAIGESAPDGTALN